MALDYDWDHNSTGFSETHRPKIGFSVTSDETSVVSITTLNLTVSTGMVYFTVAGKDSVPGAIKRAYIPSVDDGSNNIGAAVDLGIKYITSPDGIAVDWLGR